MEFKDVFLYRKFFTFSSGKSHGLLSGVKNPMTRSAASRIQSATARRLGGVLKGSFSSRAQSTADSRVHIGVFTSRGERRRAEVHLVKTGS